MAQAPADPGHAGNSSAKSPGTRELGPSSSAEEPTPSGPPALGASGCPAPAQRPRKDAPAAGREGSPSGAAPALPHVGGAPKACPGRPLPQGRPPPHPPSCQPLRAEVTEPLISRGKSCPCRPGSTPRPAAHFSGGDPVGLSLAAPTLRALARCRFCLGSFSDV